MSFALRRAGVHYRISRFFHKQVAAVVAHGWLRKATFLKKLKSLAGCRANDKIARKILALRTKAGLTQAQLAKRVGTTAPVICRLEDADYEGTFGRNAPSSCRCPEPARRDSHLAVMSRGRRNAERPGIRATGLRRPGIGAPSLLKSGADELSHELPMPPAVPTE